MKKLFLMGYILPIMALVAHHKTVLPYSIVHNSPLPITVVTEDNIRLSAIMIERPEAPRILVICHGRGDNKNLINIFANLFPHDTLIAHDFRGHGTSGGKSTIGINEYKDVQAILKYVHTYNIHKKPVFGIGISMGGVSLAKAVAHGSHLDGVVIDSAYADLHSVVQREANRKKLTAWIPTSVQNVIIRLYCGGDTKSSTIENYGKKITVPTLIFHDTADQLIPYEHGLRIKQAIPHSILQTTQGISHACICGHQPAMYSKNADVFFNSIQKNL